MIEISKQQRYYLTTFYTLVNKEMQRPVEDQITMVYVRGSGWESFYLEYIEDLIRNILIKNKYDEGYSKYLNRISCLYKILKQKS